MNQRVIGTFWIPAVIDTDTHARDWKYSGWRVVVTEGADRFLVQHLLHLVRS